MVNPDGILRELRKEVNTREEGQGHSFGLSEVWYSEEDERPRERRRSFTH